MSRRDRNNDNERNNDRDRRKSERDSTIRVNEDEITTEGGTVDVFPTFDAMGLRDDLLRGIYSYGNY